MTDRTELLESALDSIQTGIALFGFEGEVQFWNRAAEAITGYADPDLEERPIPHGLEALATEKARHRQPHAADDPQAGHGVLVRVRHKLGHEIPLIARLLVLRDVLGERIGTAAMFHPAESVDALPHGATGDNGAVVASQAELEEQLQTEFEDFSGGGSPLGVLWISVDQAQSLRKTHGSGACEAMLEKVERAVAKGLRPAEVVGRWGDDEFLIIAHERSQQLLAAHAQVLAGMARTTDFRWWGDRISLTVSIGAAQSGVCRNEGLAQLLERARSAMESSMRAGGNAITSAPGGQQCLPS